MLGRSSGRRWHWAARKREFRRTSQVGTTARPTIHSNDEETSQERLALQRAGMSGEPQGECTMHKTRNDIPENTRKEMITLLNQRLADVIDLQLQAKLAHWNVRGPNFIALHKLFDEVAETVEEYVDLIAERTAALGGT